MQIYYPIIVDLNQVGLIPTVKAKQGDSGRGLIATLTNAGQVVSATGNTCLIYAVKPDNTKVYATCTVTSDGKVKADFTTQMLAVVGTVQVELEMQNGNDIVTTPIMKLVVMPTNIDDSAIESQDELTVLQGLVNQFTTDKNQLIEEIDGFNDEVADLRIDIEEIEPGLSDAAKIALLNCFQHVAWADEHGQTYYDALEDALYESVDTSYINAVYSAKSWGKYAGDSVDSLKTDLIVTYYARQGAAGVNVPAENYTLTGNMIAGLQTFTVTYRGKIATFNAQILNGLPSGYTKLQYVQTDGRQYIDTGISETQVDSAIYKMRVTGIAAGTDSYASGQHFFSSANFYFPLLKNNTSGEVISRRFGNESLSSGSKALAWDEDIDYEFKAYIDNDAVFVNGQQLFEIAAGSTKDSTKKMHLFTFGGYPDMEKFRFCGRFYGLTVYGQTGDVVLSLIPAKNSNNVAGVYDAISGSFFTSNTTYPLQAGEVA